MAMIDAVCREHAGPKDRSMSTFSPVDRQGKTWLTSAKQKADTIKQPTAQSSAGCGCSRDFQRKNRRD
jgi:hypothetical protein